MALSLRRFLQTDNPMRIFRLFLTITVLSLASFMQLQAQALYRPKPETPPTVPYYSCIRASGAQIISDDPLLISSYDAKELIKSLYPREFHTSRVQFGLGAWLIPIGSVTTISGLLFYLAAASLPKDEGHFSFTRGFGGAGTYCTLGGIVAFGGGIVLISNAGRTVGKIVDDYHATFKPKSELSFRPTSNGLGLVLSF